LALALAAEAEVRHPSASTTPAIGDAYNELVGSGIVATLRGHQDSVSGVAFSRDGSQLATASDDGSIKLWDPVTGREAGDALEGDSESWQAVAFSPSGDLVAGAGDDGRVTLWDSREDRRPYAARRRNPCWRWPSARTAHGSPAPGTAWSESGILPQASRSGHPSSSRSGEGRRA
jgi:WD40 repeat protein